MLQVTHLCKSYGEHRVVNDLSFEVITGDVVALIGPNGAGKSTTFNLLTGQLPADAGDIRWRGQSLLGLSAHHICRLGVGRTFQIAQVFDSFSVAQNVQVAILARDQKVFHWWHRTQRYALDEVMYWLEQVGLAALAQQPASALSYGDIKRLELVLALVSHPTLLLMDEPTAGMATQERHALMTLVLSLVQQHRMAVLFTEHSMDIVFDYAQRILVLAQGELVAQGPPDVIQSHDQVQSLYLGRGLMTPMSKGLS
jgi:ABC-type branched-subunit amino acid transport system ATPase component